ncbi:MAG: hypothetical protein HYV03_05825 [Deltaproteobacteria bacterium]|nr:hypothetical protein [Deltaproteobacteria bacterium]
MKREHAAPERYATALLSTGGSCHRLHPSPRCSLTHVVPSDERLADAALLRARGPHRRHPPGISKLPAVAGPALGGGVLLLILLLTASGAFAKSEKTHLLDLYNHEAHNEYFEAAKVECTLCHQGDKAFTRATVNLRGCHQCHNNPKAPAPAPQECTLCHNTNFQPIKPKSHASNWSRIHAHFAKQDGKQCAACHAISFCVDCHQQRDTVRQTMHPRNFRFMHSIEARANPARCDKCHTVTYCTQCHTQRSLP